jgi:tetratricopeptide (TPR) repeat protein
MRASLLALALVGCGGQSVEPEASVTPVSEPIATQEPVTPSVVVEEAPVQAVPLPAPPTEEELYAAAMDNLIQASALLTTGIDADTDRAIEILREITREYPDEAVGFYNLGIAYQLRGSENDSRRSFLRATDIEPRFGDAWLNLGAVQAEAGDFGRALQYYRAGLREDQENMVLWSAVMNSERILGRLDEAEETGREALLINSKSPIIYNGLAQIYIDRARGTGGDSRMLDRALFYLRRGERAGATVDGVPIPNARIQCNLGVVYSLKNLPFDARAAYLRALEVDPDLMECSALLVDDYLLNRNYESALPLLERAVELEPGNHQLWINLGVALRGVERYEDSEAAYEEALRLNPDDLSPVLNMAILKGDFLNDFEGAIALYERYRDEGGARADEVEEFLRLTSSRQRRIAREERRRARREQSAQEEAERARLIEEADRQASEEAERQAAEEVQVNTVETEGTDAPEPEPAEQLPTPQENSPWQ